MIYFIFLFFLTPVLCLLFPVISLKEEEWEKELEAELQDYEVVNDGNKIEVKNEFWDKDIDEMLDEGDLK